MRWPWQGQGVHFEGQPSTFRQMRALFPTTDTRRIVAAKAIDKKVRISRLQAAADRILRRSA